MTYRNMGKLFIAPASAPADRSVLRVRRFLSA
jgi:hypothetical protein